MKIWTYNHAFLSSIYNPLNKFTFNFKQIKNYGRGYFAQDINLDADAIEFTAIYTNNLPGIFKLSKVATNPFETEMEMGFGGVGEWTCSKCISNFNQIYFPTLSHMHLEVAMLFVYPLWLGDNLKIPLSVEETAAWESYLEYALSMNSVVSTYSKPISLAPGSDTVSKGI